MRTARHTYVIAYDIPDDARRLKVARWLERFGQRRQYSVFECELSAAQLERVKAGLLERLMADEDSLLIYRVAGRPELILGTEVPSPKENHVV